MERNAYETRLGLINFWAHMPKYLRIKKKFPSWMEKWLCPLVVECNAFKKQCFSSERWFINLYAKVNFKCSFQTKFPASLLNKKDREKPRLCSRKWSMAHAKFSKSNIHRLCKCTVFLFWSSQKLMLLLN